MTRFRYTSDETCQINIAMRIGGQVLKKIGRIVV